MKNGNGKPLKVMHVVDILALAGMEHGVIKLVNRLDPEHYKSSICCLHNQYEETVPLLHSNVKVYQMHKKNGRDLKLVFRMARLLREQQVDIIHSHNWPTFFHSYVASRIARVPVVIHGLHGYEAGSVTRKRKWVEKWLAHRVNRIATVSPNLEEEAIDRWKIPSARITTIHNGVDSERFGREYDLQHVRKELGISNSDFIALNIGGLRKVKDHATLIRGFARLHRKQKDCKLLIVGRGGNVAWKESLLKLAKEEKVSEAIVFTGLRQDIPQLMCLCDVYINSSTFEGMSNTILEAMASSKPIVATRVGGNPKLVENGKNGYLFEVGDSKELGAKLQSLYDNPGLRKEMGERSRKVILANHSLNRMVRQYGDLYQAVSNKTQSLHSGNVRATLKRALATGLRYSGLNYVRERKTQQRLRVLMYHRVLPGDEAKEYPYQGMVIQKQAFERQMAYLAKHYNVIDLAEAVSLRKTNDLPKRAVAVTFDDGYLDNYEQAFPVLDTYGIPATFFVVTKAIDGNMELWWDRVARHVRSVAGSIRKLELLRGKLPEQVFNILSGLDNGKTVQQVSQSITDILNKMVQTDRHQVISLLDTLEHSGDHRPLMLNWEQLKTMYQAGMRVENHTATHPFFDEIADTEIVKEIEECNNRIKEMLGYRPQLFAYPRGRYREDLEPLFRRTGIEAAVTTDHGLNTATTGVYQMKRVDAGYCQQNGIFVGSILDAELQGWFRRP